MPNPPNPPNFLPAKISYPKVDYIIKVLLWKLEEKRRVGRPTLTIKSIIEEDTGLKDNELFNVMQDRVVWKDFIVSPTDVG